MSTVITVLQYIAVILGAVSGICTVLGPILPGKAGAVAKAIGVDIGKALAALKGVLPSAPTTLLFVALAAVGASTPFALGACKPGQSQSVVVTLPPLAACVIEAAGSDFVAALNDPLTLVPVIAGACAQYGLVTAESILAIIESWFASAPSFDAGPPDGAVGGAVSVQAARLANVRDVLRGIVNIHAVQGH